MNSRSITKLNKQLAAQMLRLGRLRDQLDETIDTASELKEHCEEAWEDLQRARDALSQLV